MKKANQLSQDSSTLSDPELLRGRAGSSAPTDQGHAASSRESGPASPLKTAGASLPFTEEHMVRLLLAHEAYAALEDFLLLFTNMDPDAGFMGGLRQIDELLCELSPLYDEDKDWDEQEFGRILDDRLLGIREKARRLMGGQ